MTIWLMRTTLFTEQFLSTSSRRPVREAASTPRRGLMQALASMMIVSGLFHGQAADAQSMDMVVKSALERHPRVAELRQAVEVAEADIQVPQAYRNAQVALEGGIGSQRSRDSGTSPVIAPTLRVRKLVHDSGRIDQEVRLREARLDGARNTLVSGTEDLALEVVTAYLQVAKAIETLKAVREWIEGLRGIASMTDQIQQIDRGRQFDNALAVSRVQRAEAEMLARNTSLADAQALLAGLVGRPVEPMLPVAEWPTSGSVNFDALLASHPQMRIAEATINAAREQSVLDKLYDRPSLSVEAFVSSGHDWRGQFRPINNVGVQLVGNVSLLDGGAGAATSKVSMVRLQQAERARDAVQVELLTIFSRLRSSQEGSTARSDSYALAYRQAVTLAARMREQFRAGRRPLVDLLSQETEIYQMKLSTLGERYDALLTEARLAHTLGQLLAVLKLDMDLQTPR